MQAVRAVASAGRRALHAEALGADPGGPVRQAEVSTCGALFERWRRERRYWAVPRGDVRFRVQYADTDVPDAPTVLALHGSPGSFRDFEFVATQLRRRGVRTVAPLFPDATTVRLGRFRHTPEEKAEYIKDFLKTIGVPRVDLVLCHSSAMFPGLLLCQEERLDARALALLNPTAFDVPRIMQPYWLVHALSRLYEFPGVYQFADSVGRCVLKGKPHLKGGSHMDHYLSAFTMVYSRIPQQFVHFRALVDRRFPVLLAYSENDRLIAQSSLHRMRDAMGRGAHRQRYDALGNAAAATDPGGDPRCRVLVFEKGTHFLLKKYPEIVADEIYTFLQQQLAARHH